MDCISGKKVERQVATTIVSEEMRATLPRLLSLQVATPPPFVFYLMSSIAQSSEHERQSKRAKTTPIVRMDKKLSEEDIRQYRRQGFNVTFLGKEGTVFKYSMGTFSIFPISSGPHQVEVAKQICEDQRRMYNIQPTTVVHNQIMQSASTSSSSTTPVTAYKVENDLSPKNQNPLFAKLGAMCAERADSEFVQTAFDPICMNALLQATQHRSNQTYEDKLHAALSNNFDRLTLRRFLVFIGHAPENLPSSFVDKVKSVVKYLLD